MGRESGPGIATRDGGPARARWGALVGALALALAAQYLFTGEVATRLHRSDTWHWRPAYSAGSLLLLAAVGLSTWACRLGRGEPSSPARSGLRLAESAGEGTWGLWLSLTATVLSTVGYLLGGETPAVLFLWLLAVAAAVVPLFASERPRLIPRGIGAWEWGAVALVTAVAFFLRFHRLTELPSHVDPDVALMGWHTLELIRTDGLRWIGMAPSEHSFVFHQLLALSMRLFGADHAGLVTVSVVAGTLTVPLVFLLGRVLFSRAVGLVAAGFLAANYAHFHFSRILFGPIPTCLLVLALLLLFLGLREGKAGLFAAAGVATGAATLTYYSGRVAPLVVGSLFLGLLAWRRSEVVGRRREWAALAVGLLAAVGPFLGYALSDFRTFAGRANHVMLWAAPTLTHSLAKYGTDSALEVVLDQSRATLLSLHLYGDESPHFGIPKPMVGAPVAALFVLGLGVALARPKRPAKLTLLAWIGLTFLLGGILTSDPPYWPHLNIAIPAIVLLSARGLEELVESAGKWIPATRPVAWGAVAVGLVLLVAHNWAVYVDYAGDNAGRRVRASRWISSLPPGTRVLVTGGYDVRKEHTFLFFNRDRYVRNAYPEEMLAMPDRLDRPTALLFYAHEEFIEPLRRKYPRATYQEHGPDGTVLFRTLLVPAETPPGSGPAAGDP